MDFVKLQKQRILEALNLKTGKETKQPGISGYAHNEEICFIGKDKIVAMGNPVMTKILNTTSGIKLI